MSHIEASRSHLGYAQAYAHRYGYRVFPLHSVREGVCSCGQADCTSQGKHPRTKNGVKAATTNLEQISQWWSRWPDANIGIATGNGLYVIDVDCAKGGDLDSLLPYNRAEMLSSLMIRTGSGGYHIYLSHDPALILPNTTNKLGPYIDTRGTGGYVVAPPSSNLYGPYTVEARSSIVAMPEELLTWLRKMGHVSENKESRSASPLLLTGDIEADERCVTSADPSSGPLVSMSNDAETIPEVARESRNAYLTHIAGKFRRTGLHASEICAALHSVNMQRYGEGRHPRGPLALEELERTVFKSVARWEREQGPTAVDVPCIHRLTSLMSGPVPEVQWIVPGVLAEGLSLLAGKPKTGKSWLALSLLLNCALGSQSSGLVLGRYAVEPMEVLYLSLEDTPARFYQRVKKLLGDRPVPEGFSYALHWKALAAGGLDDLETYLTMAPETRLVFIDTLAKVRTVGKNSGNVYQEDYALMSELQQLAMRHHIGLVLVHHLRKGDSLDAFDDISGSTGLTGAADTNMVLQRARNQPKGSLHITGRDVEEQELSLTFHEATCLWTIDDNNESAADRQSGKGRQAILDLLSQNGAMTPIEIAKMLGKPAGSIRNLIFKMLRAQTVIKGDDGCYILPPEEAI